MKNVSIYSDTEEIAKYVQFSRPTNIYDSYESNRVTFRAVFLNLRL